MPDPTIFLTGLVTFFMLIGGLAFTVYEMRTIASRAIKEADLQRNPGTPAIRSGNLRGDT